jgi:diguanylate cyclase (GGDEF)-like protein/PAS domain S-box-containing protein
MADREQLDTREVASLVRRLDRQRRAHLAAKSISDQATHVLYDKQHHLALLQAIAVAANESNTFAEALQSTLDEICMRAGWPLGHAYLTVGRTDILALSDARYIDDLDRNERVRAAIEGSEVSLSGVASRARGEGKAVCSNELAQAVNPVVAGIAAAAGLHSVVAFPAMVGEQPVAVLECFSEGEIVLEPDFLEVLKQVGLLLGKVHQRTQAEVTQRSSDEQYRLLFEGNPNPMWIYDAGSSSFLGVNDAFVARFGYLREEILRMKVDDIRPPGHSASPFTAPARNERQRISIWRKDGTIAVVEITARELRLPGRIARLVMAVEISDGSRTEQELRESERRFRDLLDNVQLAAMLIDVVGVITYCNPYLLTLSGWDKRDVIGARWFDLFVPDGQRETASLAFFESIRRGQIAAQEESQIVTKRGERRSMVWNNTILRNSEGSVLGIAGIGLDVTEKLRAERQLLHDAFHDSLTGLPNRSLFLDRASQTLARYRRNPWDAMAVLLLDIDRFKDTNDALGHAVGDELLVILAERICRSVRSGDTVARISGDEFAILLENIIDMTEATRTADRVQQAICTPVNVGGEEIFTSASIGITVAGPEYEDPARMLSDAEVAMYRAKADGKARYEIFDARMRAETVTRINVERDLRRAIDRGELRVLYQPLINLQSGSVSGFEALVRWQHPTSGMISPADFIPIAEETGLISEIGEFVIDQACGQAARLVRERNSNGPLPISINLSGRQFSESNLVQIFATCMEDHGIDGSRLHLEITETLLMQNAEIALATMENLGTLGLRFSLDDFGTGYSSLSYLHRFPIHQIKIDASFVQSSTEDRKNAEIIRSIVDLGRNLDMDVVAEGIETSAQLEQLRRLRCGFGQGYLFARPLDAEAAIAFDPTNN